MNQLLHRGCSAYLALYRSLPAIEATQVLCARHQREAGYTEDEL